MKAWQLSRHGEPQEVLELAEVPAPSPGPGQLLVRVLAAAANFPDALLCLGDSIYEYRFSNAVIGRLRELDALTIQGNHEEVFLGAAGARARSGAEIDRASLDWLAGRPHRRELRIDGKRILMVHSTPWEPRGSYVLPQSAELQRFGEADADIVLYGHTHRQFVGRIGRILVVNPGSAGDARDPHNGGQLSCAVLDTVTEEVVVHDFPARPKHRHCDFQ